MSRYAIQALVDGVWAREHAGAVDDSTLFGSRSEAIDALPDLATALGCEPSELRVVSASVEITVPANPDADDCLADAAATYVGEHRSLRGWDLAPRWTDEDRETVTLSVPRWHYEAISDTSGT